MKTLNQTTYIERLLSSEITETSVVDQANLARDQQEAEQVKARVMAFCRANTTDARRIVEKFGLDWASNKDFGNGITRVGFYTDCSQRFLVMELHLRTSDWFR